MSNEKFEDHINDAGVELFGATTKRFLTDKQIDELLEPARLVERIPGLADKLDATQEISLEYNNAISKYTHKNHDGWSHIGAIPTEIAIMLQQLYTPEELLADNGKVLRKWIARNKHVRVSDENL